MATHSPASSPRLPSPPPMAEDQVGPTSPGISLFEDHGKLGNNTTDNASSRRIRPGTKAEDMAEGPPLIELQDLDSAFQLTEHLAALHHSYTHPSDSHTTQPLTPTLALQLTHPPPSTAKEIWLYELARFLIQKTNAIIVGLFADSPPCSAQTCPEMRASEWQYLCAVHDPPKSCSAVDYCCHTLDWAATTLTSSKMFPSRLGLGSGAGGLGGLGGADKVLQQQMKEITNIFRRVYRIYAHAWFQHREMFWRVEGKTGLYVLFKTVCDEYGLIQPENYTIPPEAEGQEPQEQEMGRGDVPGPTLLKRDPGAEEGVEGQEEPVGNRVLAAGDTTKRHRHTLSDRSSSVTTVIQEEAEEDEQSEGHPSLERQATSLRDFAESLPQPSQTVTDLPDEVPVKAEEPTVKEEEVGEEELPVPGIERSETIKPSKEEGGEEEIKDEEDERKSDITVVEAEDKEEQDKKVEAMEPEKAPAAEGEEAGKTVAD